MEVAAALLVCALCALCGTVHGYNSYVYWFDELLWHMIDRGFQGNFSGDVVDQVLNIYAPTSGAVLSAACRNDSAAYRRAVENGKGWALRMLDAGSKVPSGLLTGNVLNLGNYDECLDAVAVPEFGAFMGQHCMVDMNVNPVMEDANITAFRANANGLLGEFTFMLGAKWSVCIPSSCSPRDLEAHLRSVLKDMMGDINVTVDNHACRSKAHPPVLTPADWFAICFFMFFGVLVLLSTAYDFIHRKSASRSNLLASFSVYTNSRKLLTLSPGSDNLQALHGLRTLSMMWVVIGHTYDQMLDSPAINSSVADLMRALDWRHAALLNYRLAVDTFLLLSGLLLCYGFLKGVTRGTPFNLMRFYLHRYIRLTPAYAAMILLTATLIGWTGDGPLWREVVIADQEKCKSNWWTGLLYINNYVQPLDACMDQSWYLSVDMQLYLLSPLLLYPLWRWKVYGKVLLAGLIFTGVLTGFLIGWVNEFVINPEADINVSEYLPTHARFTTWVMGVALGYLLHASKDTPRLSPLVVVSGWILSAALLFSAIVANHVLADGDLEYNRIAEALNSGLNKPAWALGVAWIVLACSRGYGGLINWFLSSRIFQLLSRLTYCVYLGHYAFILWLTGSIKAPIDLSDRTILMVFLTITVMAFAAALVLSLVFEVPALVIEKILLGTDKPTEGKQSKYVLDEANTKDHRLGEELVEIIGSEATFKNTEG